MKMKVPHVGDHIDGELGRILWALSVADRTGDDAGFRALCRRHAAELDARCDAWLRAPGELLDAMRRDMDAMRPYLRTVRRIASELDLLGRPGAERRMAGADAPGNPLERIHEADVLFEEGEFEAGEALLRDVLDGIVAESALASGIHSRLADYALARDDLETAAEHARRAHGLALRAGEGRAEATAAVLDDLLTARELRRGTPDAQQLGACRETLTSAQKLSDRAWFAESNRVLRGLLAELDTLPREASGRRFLGKLYGLMGLNHFHEGDRDRARRWTRRALNECRRRRDRVGVEVYTANLKEIGRGG
ncbi:hypothetical protein [Streptomyces sp. I05A-00742]|uniref:hypothetical protein n=1 Tax=Streptomyces sp. I05A-00742 TaxID=2732853 RepID=UPI001489303A|nr:hypothetical protein [Streptomyces sp. I05A-00742]